MGKAFLIFNDVSFSFESASDELFNHITVHFSDGWTGIVGPNGSGKTTFMKLAVSMFEPDIGSVQSSGEAVYCAQRTDNIPPMFEKFLYASDRYANIVKNILEIKTEWLHRWDTLSHGERKRVQIAIALWQEPDVLCIDEPTNHLDSYARDIVIQSLKEYRGIGLLVSHDRELLDFLCSHCLFLAPPTVTLRPGGVTAGTKQEEQEFKSKKKLLAKKKKEYRRLKKETAHRKKLAESADSRVSKQKIGNKDHDAKAKIDLARLTGKDSTGGKLLKQMNNRLERARNEMDTVACQKEYVSGIWLPSSVSNRKTLLHLVAETISLGQSKALRCPEIYVKPNDRIALTGKNGTGKSTLIKQIVKNINAPDDKITYIPQEVDLRSSQEMLEKVKTFSNEELGFLMNILSRLGSRPYRLLESFEPSPGEIRKLMLAIGILAEPHIIIMDEPTNHMDLMSIECLEDALRNCPAGLLLVSHDAVFLKNVTTSWWHISESKEDENVFVLDVAYSY